MGALCVALVKVIVGVVATERFAGVLIHADVAFDPDLPELAAAPQRFLIDKVIRPTAGKSNRMPSRVISDYGSDAGGQAKNTSPERLVLGQIW